MDFPIYLAMTAAELARCENIPPKIAWMACHFSAYGTGISNQPEWLPEGSLLILNDRMPIQGHDPVRVAEQLSQAVEKTAAWGLLIDFERPITEEALAMIQVIEQSSFPLAVTSMYAAYTQCAVFLPPVPLQKPLQVHISPWNGREIWLELAQEAQNMTLTKDGCKITPCAAHDLIQYDLHDPLLHCHYQTALSDNQVTFSLKRTPEDMTALMQEAASLGIRCGVGLYQQSEGLFYLST